MVVEPAEEKVEEEEQEEEQRMIHVLTGSTKFTAAAGVYVNESLTSTPLSVTVASSV